MRILSLRSFQVLALCCALLWLNTARGAQAWTVSSPDGETSLEVSLDPDGGKLRYCVKRGAAVVVKESPLGLRFDGHDLSSGLRLDVAQPERKMEESYRLSHGKRSECVNRANLRTLVFRNGSNERLELDLRASNDGVAFRYRVPGDAGQTWTLVEEVTGFALPEGARFWAAPSDKASVYSPAYETYYENDVPATTVASLGLGWSFPVLVRSADATRWALITEANLGANFCGTRLASAPTNGVYAIAFPNPAEGNDQGAVQPSSTLPWEMPWRVLILGDSLGMIVESTLVNDLATPARPDDYSWVKPGRVAWSWWSDQPSPRNAATQKKFIDLAAEMGWEYVLVDANWTIMEVGNVQEVLRYGKQKGVGILLWYNSGGPHNMVTEKPRDTLTYGRVREFELKMLHDWGVKGIKVDFFQSDKQNVIGLYHGILEEAARQRIMINFHGCTLPRGWERTYPHLMSMEAVRGAECYIFDDKYPEAAPVQNTILPFTRNAVGSMDFTPVTFSDNRYPHLTTCGHELALAVVFQSGWLHFADKPEAYLGLPDAPKQFLKEVPVAWDETKFVEGYPGQYVVLARRKGDNWYLAGVNGVKHARELTIKPSAWLATGRYDLTLIGDGETARTFKTEGRAFASGQAVPVKMAPLGGFAAVLKKAK